MNISLEKIDALRERADISYKEAKEILEKYEGDLVEALIHIEDLGKNKCCKDKVNKTVDTVIDSVKEVIRAGNVNKILLKKDDETIMNIPVTIGAIGIFLAPVLSALSFTGALLTKCSIEIIKEDGDVISISNFADDTINKVKNVTQDTLGAVKSKTEDTLEKIKKTKQKDEDVEEKEEKYITISKEENDEDEE
ncbi:DUF4342 domain-containing protein [Clostridiaceae bacterium M8S5]|nr:DUF4342 domain-containing protein [Clostridiaceae bacterium M8S5]